MTSKSYKDWNKSDYPLIPETYQLLIEAGCTHFYQYRLDLAELEIVRFSIIPARSMEDAQHYKKMVFAGMPYIGEAYELAEMAEGVDGCLFILRPFEKLFIECLKSIK